MQTRDAPVYNRGKYWLDKLRRSDGRERSPNWYIFWYDPAARHEASASTRTADLDRAIGELDRKWLADRSQAPAFCPTCGQPMASAEVYLLSDAIADYRLEHGDARASADSIAARLNHLLDFLTAQETARARFGLATSCAEACSPAFAESFRTWSHAQPVTWRNKAGEITASRPRSPATTEESILQLAAALNHAADADPPRSAARPAFRPHPRRQVSRPRRSRIDVAELAKMLAYAAEPGKRRGALHPFLIASIATLARPDAVFDIAVAPEREQWHPGSQMLDLNPFGRKQEREKHRATVPVASALEPWLLAERLAYDALDPHQRTGRGFLVNYHGSPVGSVRRSWGQMLEAIGLPTSREWQPYILRHSLATIVRNHGGVDKWDLEGFMGHNKGGSSTETYAIGRFASVARTIEAIFAELETRAPGTLRRNCAETPFSNTLRGKAKNAAITRT
jgi:integrase